MLRPGSLVRTPIYSTLSVSAKSYKTVGHPQLFLFHYRYRIMLDVQSLAHNIQLVMESLCGNRVLFDRHRPLHVLSLQCQMDLLHQMTSRMKRLHLSWRPQCPVGWHWGRAVDTANAAGVHLSGRRRNTPVHILATPKCFYRSGW